MTCITLACTFTLLPRRQASSTTLSRNSYFTSASRSSLIIHSAFEKTKLIAAVSRVRTLFYI